MKKKAKKKAKHEQKEIAKERLGILFDLADQAALAGDLEKADEYVDSARKISMKFNLRIPKIYKRKVCKYCYRYLLPGVTSRSRINPQEHRVEVRCLRCNKTAYFPYIREIKEKRKDEGKNAHVTDR